ncbi:ATP-binding cassette domain-containing protein [Labrenzia sp. VG12]|uniref:ATP-binding cassette domain-containing protein n=1 Tax=Labrenzia sp. VG12 TaxID=2021862 RepID=UPI001AD8F12C|nr:ATP-binding cassette domain-containing protein [Labrenzia sp. VG12]
MSTDTAPLLNLDNLSARIGRQVVLDKVCLKLDPGECVAVVGGSGAGKSTLLRCVMGLTRPARPFEGSLTFNGSRYDLAARPKSRNPQGMAYVPQNPDYGFDPLKRLRWQWRQTARQVEAAGVTPTDKEKLFEALGLSDFGSRFPHQWSRGMQQRLLLAMALLGAPRLLILDEPTSALDPLIAAQVLRLVRDHAARHNIALLMVTHDLALASRYANRTAIMAEGRVVEFGPTERLLNAPASDFGKLLVSHRSWHRANTASNTEPVAAE